MTDDEWTDLDDASVQMWVMPEDHPVKLTTVFLGATRERATNRALLESLVTPESLTDWGDFGTTEQLVDESQFGISSLPRQYEGVPDVAYVNLIHDQTEVRLITQPEEVRRHVATWIYRPELGGWKIHSISGAPVPPAQLKRTSRAGEVPDLGDVGPAR